MTGMSFSNHGMSFRSRLWKHKAAYVSHVNVVQGINPEKQTSKKTGVFHVERACSLPSYIIENPFNNTAFTRCLLRTWRFMWTRRKSFTNLLGISFLFYFDEFSDSSRIPLLNVWFARYHYGTMSRGKPTAGCTLSISNTFRY